MSILRVAREFGKRLPRLGNQEGTTLLGDVIHRIIDDIAGVKMAKPDQYDSATMLEYEKANTDYGVFEGLMVEDPTTPSSQLTGAAGVTEWRVDISAGSVIVDGVEEFFTADNDHVVHETTNLLADGEAVYGAIIAKNDAGTVTTDHVVGTPATSGDEEPLTDTEISSDVGHDLWIPIARIHLHRDGDVSVAQVQANRYRANFLGLKTDGLSDLVDKAGAISDYDLTLGKS